MLLKLLVLVLFLLESSLYAAPRDLNESFYLIHKNHHVIIRVYENEDGFNEIDIQVSGKVVATINSIPDNLVRFTVKQTEARLDSIVSYYEEEFGDKHGPAAGARIDRQVN